MTATALMKVDQGSGTHTDVAGNSVKGDLVSGTVEFSNGDDTDVVSWKYEVVDVPPGSTVPKATQGPGPVTTYTMAQPDVPGSYRVQLTVYDVDGNEDIDIRNLIVPFTNGIMCPPYQGNPPQRPLTGPGAKPDEMNVGGQAYGWHGDGNVARPLMYQVLQAIDAGIGAIQIRFQLTGTYDTFSVPDTFVAPKYIFENRTITKVAIVRRTAGTAGTTRCDVLVNGVSIFANPADMPQVTAAAGDNASNVTTTILSPNVSAGDYIDVELEAVETALVGPPAGPEGFEVVIHLV